MAESVLLPLLVEVAKPMVKVVMSRVMEEFRYTVHFTRELSNLKEKIQIIEGIVDSMTAVRNRAVELWLRKTISIIRNAEHMMDVLAYEKQRFAVMKRRFVFLESVYLQTKMGSWIRKINNDINAIVNQARFINDLKALLHSASLQSRARITGTVNDQQVLQQVRRNVDTSLFVGRDSDVATVVNMLCCNIQDSYDHIRPGALSVVAIVGIGGLGKTTLAKQVCKNERVIDHFSEKIWIPELKEINIERTLNEMVEFLGMGKYEDTSKETTIRKLQKQLGGKRYLLVLDDVWNVDKELWNSMKNALEEIGGSKDSMVLTTTRDDAVVETMHATSSVHRLLGLSEEDSWSLFEQIVFENWFDEEALAMEACGRKIVAKCKGVPLAIRSIAGMLHNKRNLQAWRNIEESNEWGKTGVLPSLKLSYDHLSTPMLKKCFSLCAFLPKDKYEVFQKTNLICTWMALGLIQNSSSQNITLEDIGEDYINELLSISFLLVCDRSELGEVTYYKLHDLVYDFARSLAMYERLYLEADGKENKVVLDIQHLTIVKFEKVTSDFPDKLVLQNIRSIVMLENLPRGLLVHLKYLRVLALQHSNIEVVPKSIGKSKCLKYLDLGNNPIRVLPESVMELYNLQSVSLFECKHISTLPEGLSNLVNLRHLILSFHLFLTEEGVIEQLSQLQTLPPLQISEEGFKISELGSLDNVKGSLDIKGLELTMSKLEAQKSKLSMKPRVEELRLRWDSYKNNINHEEVLDGLRPNPSLKVLSIKGYGGDKFPSWLMNMNVSEEIKDERDAGSLCNLLKIELIDCGGCQQLPTLGHLPSLKMLEIRNITKLKEIGSDFYGGNELLWGIKETSSIFSSTRLKSMASFSSLKKLQLIDLGSLEDMVRSSVGFPSLEVLVIERCRKLRSALSDFPNLKELIVKDMCSNYPVMSILSNKKSLRCLKKLEIVEVEELTHIPDEVGACTSLEVFIVQWCPKLVWIPNIRDLSALREIELLRNDGLKGAPEGLESCKSLEKVWIYCCGKMKTLPDLAGLSRVRNLSIQGMRKMISEPPEWLYNLPSLRVLHIGDYWGLNEFPDFSCLLNITSLERLFLYGWKELQSIPQQLQQFTGLKILAVCGFDDVEEVPEWLGNLSSLHELGFKGCKKLKTLPSREAMDRLHNLRLLVIEDCPMLEEVLRLNGAEHHKIHVEFL